MRYRLYVGDGLYGAQFSSSVYDVSSPADALDGRKPLHHVSETGLRAAKKIDVAALEHVDKLTEDQKRCVTMVDR